MINLNKIIVITLAVFISSALHAQEVYEPNWESIDSRPIPEWYGEAKFGIFIHWGPYSVPAFSKTGQYSEWYWEVLQNPERIEMGHKEVKEFHDRVYGKNFTYPDFVPMFKAELFNPTQWAKLFEESGAKYVVLTSKHHDGYCLWPSEESNKNWGRPWCSTNSGPMRDLIGELTNAVRQTNVKMGLYYSLYEWNNPLYNNNLDLYVEKHMLPQFKDLVERYSPSLIFSDGQWHHHSKDWRATELLSWLYNESSCKKDVVINDRWGKDTRETHGGYYTTEYGSGLSNAERIWEENRGMGYSFGFSRNENIQDYNSSQELIYMLIDIVSRGGNFLLDIGPTADGRIPVIMQERLLEIGDWLKVNGESIYGTTCWKNTCQWTNGKIEEPERGQFKLEYDVMKLTVNPDEGMATKEIFFTEKEDDLYCVCPIYPNNKLIVRDVKLGAGAKVEMLGYRKKISWKQKGKNVIIEVPQLTVSEVPCQYAWTFKLSGVE